MLEATRLYDVFERPPKRTRRVMSQKRGESTECGGT